MVVALDGTERGESMLGPAADLAAALGMSLRLIQDASVQGNDSPSDGYETGYLLRLSRKVAGLDRSTLDYDVLHGGHPARDLAQYTALHDEVGLIAMATRGLDARQRLLHHSTTFDVARHAHVPVVVLHDV
jgi:nucleotide-binding universal stress UspA family protein